MVAMATEHVLDVQHGLRKRSLDQQLQLNGEAPDTYRPGYFVPVPSPGSAGMEPGPQPPPQQQPTSLALAAVCVFVIEFSRQQVTMKPRIGNGKTRRGILG